MHKLAVIFNGPPGCGKDTLAERLKPYGFQQFAMKEQLYKASADYFGLPVEDFRDMATDRKTKEMPTRKLMKGKWRLSPRQAMILLSEDILKPLYGKSYFGQMTAEECRRAKASHVAISDGGFVEEVQPIRMLFDRTAVIRLHREGFDFEGDSRSYLEGLPDTYDLNLVEGAIDDAVTAILRIIFPA
jgi:DNA polymerase III delta prime subunit